MSRDWRLYWNDVIAACRRIESYVAGMTREQFEADQKTYDAVVRNLEIVGEAIKNLPESARALAPEIAWRRIAGMRDFLTHAYFGINNNILWDVISNKVPELRKSIEHTSLPPSA